MAELIAVNPEYAGAESVKGGDPHLAGVRADEEGDAVLHLARGLVGEGYGEDLFGGGESLVYEVGDPVRQHAGLPAPGAREDE